MIGISHTGHLYHEKVNDWQPVDVKTQINDKIKYLEEYLFKEYPDTNIILIGHSIGCYIILEILSLIRKDLKSKIKKSMLLFPTIERMSQTPNGKVLTFFTRFFMWLIYFVSYLITLFPEWLQKSLINIGFTQRHSNSQNQMIDNIDQMVFKMCTTFSCAKSCFFMGKDEMGLIHKRNSNIIKQNLDLLLFYYGVTDKWCPLQYYYDMKDYVTNLPNPITDENSNKPRLPTLVLDTHGLDHAFVIYKKQCSIIANMISEWILSL